MSRVKGGFTRSRSHKQVKKDARGFAGHRRRTIKGAKEGILHALSNAFIGRKLKKRSMRSLWIIRLNAALRNKDLSYSRFIRMLKQSDVVLNRKVLSELAVGDPQTLSSIIDQVAPKGDE